VVRNALLGFKAAGGQASVIKSYTLLGDPALVVKR
jgi:hypothetical protein